jgi:sialidase-1
LKGRTQPCTWLPDGAILCFYETTSGSKPPARMLMLARFNLEWLTDGKDTMATAP